MIARLLIWTAGTYLWDVWVRPQIIASRARRFARQLGKPVINVGAGTAGSSFRSLVLGPTLWGDVNIDIASQDPVCGPRRVCHGDALRLPYPDKAFGSLIASHVLEHLSDPVAALREWQRVADRVYVVVPPFWMPHAWLHPGHRWISFNGQMLPLWQAPRGLR